MTNEEFVAKRLEWLESRKAELIEAAQTEETADGIEARNAELEGIQAEIDQIKALQEERNELNPDIEERSFEPLNTFGNKGENKSMEENRTFAIDTAEYRDAWLKVQMGKELTVEERTAIGNASAVVPTMTVDKIYGKLQENRLFRELAPTRFPGYVNVPVASTVNDANWVAMGTAATDSGDAVTSISLATWKLIKTVEVDADIANMAIPAFEEWLVAQLSSKMLRAICASALRGTGSSQPQGVLTAVSAIKTSITYDDILALMAAVDGAYHDGAVWVCSSSTYFNVILALDTSIGTPLTYQGVEGIEREPSYWLLGHRVILDSSCDGTNTASLIFGNFREGYACNFGKDPEVGSDTSVEYRKAATVFRGYALYDGKVADSNAFAVATVTSA